MLLVSATHPALSVGQYLYIYEYLYVYIPSIYREGLYRRGYTKMG